MEPERRRSVLLVSAQFSSSLSVDIGLDSQVNFYLCDFWGFGIVDSSVKPLIRCDSVVGVE